MSATGRAVGCVLDTTKVLFVCYDSRGFAWQADSLHSLQERFKRSGHFEESTLVRLFSAFPGGWPGICLLLLRAVLGVAILLEGGFYASGHDAKLALWSVAVSAFATGILLVIGFLTPIAGVIIAAGVIGAGLSWIPVCVPNLFDSKLVVIFGLTMLLAILGLGPGAFSVDARVFGRREIIIPPRTMS